MVYMTTLLAPQYNIFQMGSYAQGTELDRKSDLDVVVYCTQFRTINDHIRALPQTLNELSGLIVDWGRKHRYKVEILSVSTRVLTIRLRTGGCRILYWRSGGRKVEVDIVPAFNLLDHGTYAHSMQCLQLILILFSSACHQSDHHNFIPFFPNANAYPPF